MDTESGNAAIETVQYEVPPKPPDGIGATTQQNRKFSFRDKLLGAKEPLPRKAAMDLMSMKLFHIELEEGDRLRPKCYIEETFMSVE
jgi:hypothetical protein